MLDSDRDWQCVARPFDKFFNHGEDLAADVDWDTAVAYEKLDGTLVFLYEYDGEWLVGSTGTPPAASRRSAHELVPSTARRPLV